MDSSVYVPSDDSFLFSNFLEEFLSSHKVDSFLDMGSGSGILASTALKFLSKDNILCVDVNPTAVVHLRSLGFSVVESDLFDKVSGKFDLIVFNAPYLPFDPREPSSSALATSGGLRGDEVLLRFLSSVNEYLALSGRVFFLCSSLTPMDRLEREFSFVLVASKKVSFEELRIFEVLFS